MHSAFYYRTWNQNKICNKYPLSCSEGMFELLEQSCHFFDLDLKGGFRRVQLLSSDKKKTENNKKTICKTLVMTMALYNGPAIFQSLISMVSTVSIDHLKVSYNEEILSHVRKRVEHLNLIRAVKELLART